MMFPMRFAAAAVLAAAVLASCAPMTRSECASADWSAIGFEDGATGAPWARFSRRAEVCGAAGADRAAYEAGRAEGLRSYCTEESGYAEGYAKREYHGVCPVETAEAFRRGYLRGLDERRRAELTPRIGIGVGIGSGGRVGVGIGGGIGVGF